MGTKNNGDYVININEDVNMTNYIRVCPKGCGKTVKGTQIILTNPQKGDKVKCPVCGTEYVIGMRPFLKQV